MVAASHALLHPSASEPVFGPLAACEAKLVELFRALEVLFGPPTPPDTGDGATDADASEPARSAE